MSATARDLQYYLSHPDEMPDDPKEIERLASQAIDKSFESGSESLTVDSIVGKADEPGAAAAGQEATEKKPEPAKAEEELKGETKPADEEKPEGILAKDGKNVIPYSQLESARARAATAEALAKQQAEELIALRAAARQPAQQQEVVQEGALTEAELEALEADSPTLAKTLRAQQASITAMREELKQVQQRQESVAQSEEEVIKSEIRAAIDATPELAAWETAEDQTMWEEASRIDQILRTSKNYADVPFEDRFKKVVEMTRASLGLEPETQAPEQERQTLDPAVIKAAAEAKLAAAAKNKRPLSLSDIPGGAPPAVDERAKLEDASITALGQQFLGMSRDQLEAYLAANT